VFLPVPLVVHATNASAIDELPFPIGYRIPRYSASPNSPNRLTSLILPPPPLVQRNSSLPGTPSPINRTGATPFSKKAFEKENPPTPFYHQRHEITPALATAADVPPAIPIAPTFVSTSVSNPKENYHTSIIHVKGQQLHATSVLPPQLPQDIELTVERRSSCDSDESASSITRFYRNSDCTIDGIVVEDVQHNPPALSASMSDLVSLINDSRRARREAWERQKLMLRQTNDELERDNGKLLVALNAIREQLRDPVVVDSPTKDDEKFSKDRRAFFLQLQQHKSRASELLKNNADLEMQLQASEDMMKVIDHTTAEYKHHLDVEKGKMKILNEKVGEETQQLKDMLVIEQHIAAEHKHRAEDLETSATVPNDHLSENVQPLKDILIIDRHIAAEHKKRAFELEKELEALRDSEDFSMMKDMVRVIEHTAAEHKYRAEKYEDQVVSQQKTFATDIQMLKDLLVVIEHTSSEHRYRADSLASQLHNAQHTPLNEKVKELKNEIEELQVERDTLNEKRQDLEKVAIEMAERLQESLINFAAMQDENSSLRRRLKKATAANASNGNGLGTMIDELQSTIEDLEDRLAEEEKKNASQMLKMRVEQQDLEEQLAQAWNERDELARKLETITAHESEILEEKDEISEHNKNDSTKAESQISKKASVGVLPSPRDAHQAPLAPPAPNRRKAPSKKAESFNVCVICDTKGEHSTEQCPSIAKKWCEFCETTQHATYECNDLYDVYEKYEM
jgi:hypothetical protein